MRVEKTSREEMEQRLSRMEKKLEQSHKRVFSCFNCLVYFIILAVAAGLYLSYVIALTGVANVPFFSSKYYSQPLPYEKVIIEDVSQDSLVEQLLSESRSEFEAGEREAEVDLVLTDAYLTVMLREKLPDFRQLQMVVVDETIEIYAQRDKVVVRMYVVPQIKGNKIDIDVVDLKVGQLSLPGFIGDILLSTTLEPIVNTTQSISRTFGEIQEVAIVPGGLRTQFIIQRNAQILNVF